MENKKIVVATNNKGKLIEIKKILNDYEILSLNDLGLKIDVNEDGNSFKENAIKKAKEVFKVTNIPCISDDSGLCIDVLDGWPGIKTARFLGDEASDKDRNDYILNKMIDKISDERTAKFVCDIAYVDDKNVIVTEGIIKGKIAKEERGNNGFGFDSIFELDNKKTLSELTNEEKNALSSRKIALEKLKIELQKIKIWKKYLTSLKK